MKRRVQHLRSQKATKSQEGILTSLMELKSAQNSLRKYEKITSTGKSEPPA
jgi:hypothetical protein